MTAYKVYFENRFILISPEPDRVQKYSIFHKFSTTSELYKLIEKFQNDSSITSVNIYGLNIKHIWKLFRIYFTEVQAAGGLVKHISDRYLFIKKKGKWDLPKGHLEENETAEDCAIREVEEECGIKGHKIIKPLEPTWHSYTKEEISYLKKTEWFLMGYEGIMIAQPEKKEGITEVGWLLPDEISNIRTEIWPSLMDMINKIILTQ
ncbi:MAG: NUDIX domain-containing protein [Bacteroidales bacterium]|nr:NUDIX domain-containing protein [Bacteroidales bacterium]